MIDRLNQIITRYGCTIRVKDKNEVKPSEWANWIIKPSQIYIETPCYGPEKIDSIEYLEINTIVDTKVGSLIKPNSISYLHEIINDLDNLKILYEINNSNITIYLQELRL